MPLNLSVRLQAALLAVLFVVLALLWFFLLYRPSQSRIDELREEQDRTQQEIAQLEARLERLQELQRREPQLRAEFSRLEDALPTDPRLPDFILQVHEAANLAGVDFLSISPSLPASFSPPEGADEPPGPGELQAISVSVSTEGTYFALEDFIIRMERLQRAVRINTFSLSPTGDVEPGVSPTLSVTFSMQMFVLAPDGAPPPGEIPPPEEAVDDDAEPAPDEEAVVEDPDPVDEPEPEPEPVE
jgi:type IV pilus assembly protein PilO